MVRGVCTEMVFKCPGKTGLMRIADMNCHFVDVHFLLSKSSLAFSSRRILKYSRYWFQKLPEPFVQLVLWCPPASPDPTMKEILKVTG